MTTWLLLSWSCRRCAGSTLITTLFCFWFLYFTWFITAIFSFAAFFIWRLLRFLLTVCNLTYHVRIHVSSGLRISGDWVSINKPIMLVHSVHHSLQILLTTNHRLSFRKGVCIRLGRICNCFFSTILWALNTATFFLICFWSLLFFMERWYRSLGHHSHLFLLGLLL